MKRAKKNLTQERRRLLKAGEKEREK